MTNLSSLRFLLLCLFALVTNSCKKSAPADTSSSAEYDTRELVREAYARVNPIMIPATFNAERVALMKENQPLIQVYI